MILVHFDPAGGRRITDLQNIYYRRTAMLVGGAPSLREQPIQMLNKRGVLTMAMNNAATHFQPTLWSSGDIPECYEPQILLDPKIIKFAPLVHAEYELLGRKYKFMPSIYFYMQEANVPWDEFLSNRPSVPWYNNTLFVSLHVLYQLGVRRIILAGSDFGFAKPDDSQYDKKDGDMYAHKTELGSLERKWNLDLYNSQVRELRMLKPVLDRYGLTLMDSSKNSRIKQVYEHITLEKAIKLCLDDFPKNPVDPATLPHCSKFAPVPIQKNIAEWPGNQVVGPGPQIEEAQIQAVV